jgi:hypothetical protein
MNTRNLLGAVSGVLAAVLFAQPALAACEPAPAQFLPGDWAAWGIHGTQFDADGLSELYTSQQGGFTLVVDPSGVVTGGEITLYGGGFIDGYGPGMYDGEAAAEWVFEGDLSGISTKVHAEGITTMTISGQVDMSGVQQDPGDSGPLGFGGNAFEIERSLTFAPQEANCNTVFGDLRGSVDLEGGDDEGEHLYWLAYRLGGNDETVKNAFAELSADAEDLLASEYPDPDGLVELVRDLIGLNSLLSSPEYCGEVPGDMNPGSPLFEYAKSLLIRVLGKFLAAAENGHYHTSAVITTITMGLTATALSPDRCGTNTDEVYAATTGLLRSFEQVLLDRYETAKAEGNQVEMELILAAAYQFGFYSIYEA